MVFTALVHTGTKISLYIDGAFDSEYFNNYSPNPG